MNNQLISTATAVGSRLATTSEDALLLRQKQQEIYIQVPDVPSAKTRKSKPDRSLVNGPREDYLTFGVPLYDASMKCDWKAAKRILDLKPELVRYSLTENGDTALHLAASIKKKQARREVCEKSDG
ncbi:hypothetical protein SSX86_019175 [Deinandra increscens subsp. villosa]|uniref:Uncharacterized protein n=1 Tax=Deinandra increscens subsp. villosa TaxID=3103831 RepID=A0AAP0CS41_9ASTR